MSIRKETKACARILVMETGSLLFMLLDVKNWKATFGEFIELLSMLIYSNSRSLKPQLESLIGTLSDEHVPPSNENITSETLTPVQAVSKESTLEKSNSNVGPKQKGKRKRTENEMEEMKKKREENKAQKELENSAQRRASTNILQLREISKDHSVETEASPTSTTRAPARGISTGNSVETEANPTSTTRAPATGARIPSSNLTPLSRCTDEISFPISGCSTRIATPAASLTSLSTYADDSGFPFSGSSTSIPSLTSLSTYTDDTRFSLNTSSFAPSSSVTMPTYTDETSFSSSAGSSANIAKITPSASLTIPAYADETFHPMSRPGVAGSLQEAYPIRPMPLYENTSTSNYMRSAFNTLYPEGAECGTKCHSCCSLVREHQTRIAYLEQAFETLQRSISKKKQSKSEEEENNTSSQYGMNLDELKSNLKLKRNCSEGINYLLLKLFSIDELITSSVMGVSTKKGQRKGLNEEKRSLIEGLVAEVYPDVTITAVHNIMRDRLKLLRKRHLVTE